MARNLREGTTRRELLKLSPVLVLGAFAVPALRDPLLSAGVNLSDAMSRALFRREYSRLFGAPPQRDITRMRLVPVAAAGGARRTAARSTAYRTGPRHRSTTPSLVSR